MEPPRGFEVEPGGSWRRWVKHHSDSELENIAARLEELKVRFGKPHQHAGLGVRRLKDNVFEFRISRDLRVVFLHLRPRTLRLMMTGTHDEVRNWIKENL